MATVLTRVQDGGETDTGKAPRGWRQTPKVSLSIKATEAAASWKRQAVSSPEAFRGGIITVQRFSALVTSRAIKE